MTVKELIESLKKYDENKPVIIYTYDDGHIEPKEVYEVFDPTGDGTPFII